MKTKFKDQVVLTIVCCVLLMACASRKELAYELPEAMLPHVKTEYAKRCDQGQALYMLACAACHNTKIKRKVIIPDFNPEQLRGYMLRVSNAQHEKNMPDSMITEEELGIIMTFLSYKKKNK